jgi:hypothetical protein
VFKADEVATREPDSKPYEIVELDVSSDVKDRENVLLLGVGV